MGQNWYKIGTKKARFRSEADLRAYAEKKLGPLSDEIWGLLKDDGYISEVLSGEYSDSLRNLLERAKRLRQLAGHHVRQKVERMPPPPDMSYVIRSRLLAMEAEKFPPVREFRRKYLPNGLLSLSEVTPWIEARAKEEKEFVFFPIIITESNTGIHRLSSEIYELLFSVTSDRVTGEVIRCSEACFVKPEILMWRDDKIGTHLMSFYGFPATLYFLKLLAQSLRKLFDYKEEDAVTFILTGKVPMTYPFTSEFHIREMDGRPFFILTIDAKASPTQVARFYGGERFFPGKWRPPSPKTLEMVSFRLDHLGMSWRECWQAWNAEHPDKRYPSPERMKRDYHRAVKRILEGVPTRSDTFAGTE